MADDTQTLLKQSLPGRVSAASSIESAFSLVVSKGAHGGGSGDTRRDRDRGRRAHGGGGAGAGAGGGAAMVAQHPGGAVTSSWLDASFIILGEILGTGVLGMPKVVADLGLVPGLACILVFGLSGLYSGLLVSRTRDLLRQRPGGPVTVHSFGEAAVKIVGPRFGTFTRYAILLNWLLILPYYVMAASKSVMLAAEALWDVELCYYTASALVCVALLPLMQVQSLARLKGLAMASTMAIVAVLSLIVYFVWAQDQSGGAGALNASGGEGALRWRRLSLAEAGGGGDGAPGARGAPGAAAHGRVLTTGSAAGPAADKTSTEELVGVINSMTNVMFAYQGQSMFFEIMGEMRRPGDFPRSVYFSNAAMFLVYGGISTLVVWQVRAGLPPGASAADVADHVPSFLPSLLSGDLGRTIVTLLLTFHISVSFLITNQPLTAKVHALICERRCRPASGPVENSCGCAANPRRALTWATVTCVIIASAYLVCNLVPFFADFQAIIGAIMGGNIMFGWPTLFFLAESRNYRLDRQNGSGPPGAAGLGGLGGRAVAGAAAAGGSGVGLGGSCVARFFAGPGGSASWADVVLCGVLLGVVVPVFAVGGLASSLTSLVEHWEDYGRPFDCLMR